MAYGLLFANISLYKATNRVGTTPPDSLFVLLYRLHIYPWLWVHYSL
jgi:hypothetical protein